LTLPFLSRSLRDEIEPLPLALGGLLVVTLVVQLARPGPTLSDQREAFAWRPVATTSAPSVLGDYPRILERPLFTPSRGAAGAGAAGQSAATSLGDYTLVGVASVGGRGVAVLRGPGGAVASLHAGEALLGWRIAEISRAGVVLEAGGVRRAVAVGAPAEAKAGTP
jgi:hypothetical protein